MTSRDCPGGCGHQLHRADFLCQTCMRGLPTQLQADIRRTWKAWLAGFGPSELAAYERCTEYAVRLAVARSGGQPQLPT